MRMVGGRTVGLVLGAMALAGLAACGESGQGGQQAGGGAPPPPQVKTQKIQLQDVPIVQEYAGRTQGAREVQVRARVSGILLKRTYEEGLTVRQGDVLFRIDPQPFQVKLEEAEASLQQAQASQVKAQRNWTRIRDLFKSHTISASTRDNAQAELDLALASVAAAEAQVKAARIDLGYTSVEAPVSGVTSLEDLPEGSLVAENSLLTTITQLEPIHVVFAYPEAEQLRRRELLESGQATQASVDGRVPVDIVLGDGSVFAEQGWVDFTSSGVDPETGTIRARAIVPNPQHRLLPGQFVRVRVKGLVRENVAVIPDKALMQSPQGAFVYVVDKDGKAQIRPVTPDGLVEAGRVIEKGLSDGDRVITEGVIKVRPDAPVQVTDDQGASADGQGASTQAEGPKKGEETAE